MTLPRMERWTSLMPRLKTGGLAILSYDEGFFSWWRMQIPWIEDHPYEGMDFRNDLDLVLLEGVQRDMTCTLL
jgi:hypothetical protein